MTLQTPSFHAVDGSQMYTPVPGPQGDQGPQGDTGPQGPEGPQGIQGEVGPEGPQGPQGDPGPQGDDGNDGLSAYEVAVVNGFVGTEAAWLLSLVGPEGPEGPQGDTGPTGPAGSVTFATGAEYRVGTEAAKAISPDTAFDAADPVALTPGTNVSTDMSTGFNFTLAMGGNYTLDNPTNAKPGQCGFIKITQDGTGSRTLAYGSNWKFAGGTDPVLSTAASSIDVLFYQVLTSTSIYANLVKAIA